MPHNPQPKFREMTHAECVDLLGRNHIGRVAFSYHDHVDIEPIHFVFDEEWIYGRTGEGTKLRTLAHNRWLAFETDEIHGDFDWKSVVVKGALYILEADCPRPEAYLHALEVLRRFDPVALSAGDPLPSRNVLFRIHADQMTGRTATTKG